MLAGEAVQGGGHWAFFGLVGLRSLPARIVLWRVTGLT